jgi:hypothetical protein
MKDLLTTIASHWRSQRRETQIIDRMNPYLVQALDDLEKQDRTCICITGSEHYAQLYGQGRGHDAECPAARKP